MWIDEYEKLFYLFAKIHRVEIKVKLLLQSTKLQSNSTQHTFSIVKRFLKEPPTYKVGFSVLLEVLVGGLWDKRKMHYT